VASGKWLGPVAVASEDRTVVASAVVSADAEVACAEFACGHPAPPSLAAISDQREERRRAR
jgi:hypothetical protein